MFEVRGRVHEWERHEVLEVRETLKTSLSLLYGFEGFIVLLHGALPGRYVLGPHRNGLLEINAGIINSKAAS
jgi:hypothetical protein